MIGSWVDDDEGALTLLLPPAPAVTRLLATPDKLTHRLELTASSLWIRLNSSKDELCVELLPSDLEPLSQLPAHGVGIPLTLGFPRVDRRVTEGPPAARSVTIDADLLRRAVSALT